jgi:Tfp pilus assembly protein PilX
VSRTAGGCVPRNERGIALAVALFVLVMIGAVISGSFLAGRLEQQCGRNTTFSAQALEAAEAGLSEALVSTGAAAAQAMTVGGISLNLPTIPVGTGASAQRQLTRLTSTLWLLRSSGTRWNAGGSPLAVRSLGFLVRVIPADELGPERLSPILQRAWVELM